MKKGTVLLSLYEEAKKAGFVSIKGETKISAFDKWSRKEPDTSFWPKCPPDALEAHPAARRAHTYGSSLR